MKWISRSLTGALLASTLILATSIAMATNFGATAWSPIPSPTGSQVSLGDDKYHYVYASFMRPDLRTSLRYIRDNVYGLATDLETFEGTLWSHDVYATSGDYGQNGLFGWVYCPVTATTSGYGADRTCNGQILYLNEHWRYAYAFDTESERRFQGRHELGHTVGLKHTGNPYSCLRTGNLNITFLSLEDIGHIDLQY